MRYRKLSDDGDYVFGQGSLDFYIDIPETVSQAVQTRIRLFLGTFWRNLKAGVPWFQSILGIPGSPSNIDFIDNTLQDIIRNTQGVTQIIGYSSVWDSQNREYRFNATIQTEYSVTDVSGVI